MVALTSVLRLSAFLLLLSLSSGNAFGNACIEPHVSEVKENRSFTEKSYDEWDREIGRFWLTAVKRLNIPNDGVVVEIGPGGRAKVGYGLVLHGFRGTLYVVEPEIGVLMATVQRYRLLMPRAKIIGIAEPFEKAARHIKHKPDAILANHLLDDVLTAKGGAGGQAKAVFEACYTDCSAAAVREVWDELLTDVPKIMGLMDSVANDLVGFVEATGARTVGLSQYESYYFRMANLRGPDVYAARTLTLLKNRLRRKGFEFQNLPEATELGQDPNSWALGQRKATDEPSP